MSGSGQVNVIPVNNTALGNTMASVVEAMNGDGNDRVQAHCKVANEVSAGACTSFQQLAAVRIAQKTDMCVKLPSSSAKANTQHPPSSVRKRKSTAVVPRSSCFLLAHPHELTAFWAVPT